MNVPPLIKKISFYTSYHQFYISDKNDNANTGSRNFWSQSSFERRLAIEQNTLGVSTSSYGNILLEIIFLDTKSEITDYNAYDHIIELGLEVKSGVLQILDCPNFSVVFEQKIPPSSYTLRIYYSNLAIEDEDVGGDSYKIEIWEGFKEEVAILKQYKSN
jgi:hypothetical protein